MLLKNPFAKSAPEKKPASTVDSVKLPVSGVIPDNLNTDKDKTKGADDPLLKFEELWQPNVDKDGKPVISTRGKAKSYMPQLDPKAMNTFLARMDFTKQVKPEQLAAIAKGGEEALPALMEILNQVGRQSFATAFAGLQKMSEQGLQNAIADARTEIPDYVKDMILDGNLESTNPLMKDPAFAPLVKSVKEQYREKFPKASPAQLNEAVNAYFDNMHAKLTGVKQKKETIEKTNDDLIKAGDPTADWENWFDVELPEPVSSEVPQTETAPQQ